LLLPQAASIAQVSDADRSAVAAPRQEAIIGPIVTRARPPGPA
jgi:hypothetical protein